MAADASAAFLAVHGLAHAAGALLVWGTVDGSLPVYAERVSPGGAWRWLLGTGWLVAGALLVAGAAGLFGRRPWWWPPALGGAALSLSLLLPHHRDLPIGITADLAAVLIVLAVLARRMPDAPQAGSP